MRPLTTNQRRSVARVALATCIVSLLLLPLAIPPRTSAEPNGFTANVRVLPEIPPPLTFPSLRIRHNPFLRPSQPIEGGEEDVLPPDLVLPPNPGIASPPHLQALILGAAPKALVEVDGRTAVVGVGTKIEGSEITEIDARGIEFDNGERLELEGRRP